MDFMPKIDADSTSWTLDGREKQTAEVSIPSGKGIQVDRIEETWI
jgi:hypothetical protein